MFRILLALTLMSVLAACDDRTYMDGTRASVQAEAFSSAENSAALKKNFFGDMALDPVTGRLDLSFEDEATASPTSKPQPLVVPQGRYLAVFRPVDRISTDPHLASFGLGAVKAKPVPGGDAYVFTGEYALMRQVADDGQSAADMMYVARSEHAPVLTRSLGAPVNGLVLEQRFLAANGVALPQNSKNGLSIAGADRLRFDEWSLNKGRRALASYQAQGVRSWQGLMVGPFGAAVDGILLTKGAGPIGIDVATGEYLIVPDWSSDRRLASR